MLWITGLFFFCGCSRSTPPEPTSAPPAAATRQSSETAPAQAAGQPQATRAADTAAVTGEPDGKQLYLRHCAGCHGDRGDGQGIAARYLFPKPRDFRAGRFRLVSTENNVPTAEDLRGVLVRGMPGSAMPPWSHLSDAELDALVAEVMRLRREGAREQYINMLRQEEGLTDQEIGEEAVQREIETFVQRHTTPGPTTEVPQIGPPDEAAVARGKQVYLKQGCHQCHGEQGKGDGVKEQINDEGYPTRPRDYTRGIFKGGHDPASLYRRIAYGMPGTPMPASAELKPQQKIDLVHFIRSLSDEQTRAAAVLQRRALVAEHVPQVPDRPDAAEWGSIDPVRLGLMPLWWRDQRIEAVEIRVVHDGAQLAVHLTWDDPVENRSAVRVEDFSDAAALQFSLSQTPPFLGMGAQDATVNIWYWRADHPGNGRAVAGIESAYPNMIVSYYPFQEPQNAGVFAQGGTVAQQDRTFVAGWGSGNPTSQPQPATAAENLSAGGPGTLSAAVHVRARIGGQAVWSSGKWQLVLTRQLEATDPQEIAFRPGQTVALGVAVWDGQAGDRDGQKHITIWHTLTLEP